MSERSRKRKRQMRRVRPPLTRIISNAFLVWVIMWLGAIVFVLWGAYNVSALQQHTAVVYTALSEALERSIARRAADIVPPLLDDPQMIAQGLALYQESCQTCHGGPGVSRNDIAKGMTPAPDSLVQTAREWSAGEIYWTVKHGIKMSGMPAWRFEYSDEEIWSIVAFVMQLPSIVPFEYRAQFGHPTAENEHNALPLKISDPDPERGRLALQSYACTVCHRVPGVVGPSSNVGPPLEGMAQRRYIAGVLLNEFDNMVIWLRDPVAVDPLTAMPDMGVSPQDAADIAAYLYTLK